MSSPFDLLILPQCLQTWSKKCGKRCGPKNSTFFSQKKPHCEQPFWSPYPYPSPRSQCLLALFDTFWLFNQTLNRAQKWFNSIFNSKQNLKYSFNHKFIKKLVQNIQFKILLKKLEKKSDSKCLLLVKLTNKSNASKISMYLFQTKARNCLLHQTDYSTADTYIPI